MKKDKLIHGAWPVSEVQLRALLTATSGVVYRMNRDWTEIYFLNSNDLKAEIDEPNRTWLQKFILLQDQPQVGRTEACRTDWETAKDQPSVSLCPRIYFKHHVFISYTF